MSDHHLSNILFSSLNLPEKLSQGIEKTGFSQCTPIQAETLPLALAGSDIAGQAQTGTGKTAAFLIALMNRLLTSSIDPAVAGTNPRAMVLAPTRELALQIHKDALALGEATGLKIGVVYGGAGYDTQKEVLREGLDILIGTPGRTIDFFKQNLFNLKSIEVMVLDEADRMFDLGFIKDIRFLLRRMPSPELRLNLLFSATLSFRVTELAYEHMNNPALVKIETEKVTADKVEQSIYYTSNEEKIPLLLGLLKQLEPVRTIIFVNTKDAGNKVNAFLSGNGFNAGTLSGDVPQKKRISLLKCFQEGELPILVATDVAARGLHISDVSHVFNYDLPQDAEDYVHRIGRTARAGNSGVAISFACEASAFALPDIEAYVGHKIPTERVTTELLVAPEPPIYPKKSPKVHRNHKSNNSQRRPPRRSHSKAAPGGS